MLCLIIHIHDTGKRFCIEKMVFWRCEGFFYYIISNSHCYLVEVKANHPNILRKLQYYANK